MRKVSQFALKVDGQTVLRSDDVDDILQEITRHISLEPMISNELADQNMFTNTMYLAGEMLNWIYHEIPIVTRAEMHFEGRTGREDTYHSAIESIIIRIEGDDTLKIRTRLEEEISFREFMYQDTTFDIFEIIHNNVPSVVVQFIPRFRIPLTSEGRHTAAMQDELRNLITDELRKNSRHTYLSTVVQRFLKCNCKCEQIRHAINLVELRISSEAFSDNEMVVAKMCLESIADTKEGRSLFEMWNNFAEIQLRWKQRNSSSKVLISHVYEWFSNIRERKCYQLSRAASSRSIFAGNGSIDEDFMIPY
ncbi:MAG: hypothetical protein ACFFE3_00580 [Candidatus Thorarchaeota archaeon]